MSSDTSAEEPNVGEGGSSARPTLDQLVEKALGELLPLALKSLTDILGADSKRSRNAVTKLAAARFVLEASIGRLPAPKLAAQIEPVPPHRGVVVPMLSAEERARLSSALRAARQMEREPK